MTIETAWADFHSRMAALGELITGPDYPADSRLRAEGFRYLTRLQHFALQWFVEFGDPNHPAFMRFDDDVTRWGAPNSDNNYLRARIAAGNVYRITGNLTGTKEILLSIQAGDMALGRPEVLQEFTFEDLKLGNDGSVEILVGGERAGDNWLPLEDGADHFLVRQYILDWEHGPIAELQIERVAAPGEALAPTLTGEQLAAALDQAANWVEKSTVYWHGYVAMISQNTKANTLMKPRRPVGAAVNMLFGGTCWDLAEDEALIIEFDPPQATYWSFQMYSPTWLETLDFTNRLTSLNNGQARIDSDGRVRIIVAHRDPGYQNWLDTTGLTTGLMSYRWVRPVNAPEPVSRVVRIDELQSEFPAETPRFSVEQRRLQLEARRRGVARRFRR